MRVRLAPGRDPNQAIGELNQLIGEMSLVLSANVANKHASYIRWSADTETKLQSILRREDAMAFFNTPRHLAICGMTPTMHLNPLLVAQLDALRYELGEAVEYLTRQRDRMGASGGLPIVTDTNVLLQCQRLDQVKWAPVVGEGARLMVPLRVIEEIEDKKYSDSKRLRRRARELLPWIDKHFTDGSAGPVRLAEGATIELVLAERPRYRPNSADDEILELAQDVLQFAGRVTVMTGDTGMRGRARGEGLQVLALPNGWRLPPDGED